jgi:hypothetical protein
MSSSHRNHVHVYKIGDHALAAGSALNNCYYNTIQANALK